MEAHQFDQPEGGIKISRVSQGSPQSAQKKHSPKGSTSSPYGQNKTNQIAQRGWVFEKQLRKTHRDRINDIVETHKQKMGMIKPYNIANYGEKNSIALAYLSQTRKTNKKQK